MSDTEDSVVADSVDSTASLSPTILRGLESLKSRSSASCQVLIPDKDKHLLTSSNTLDPVQILRDSDSQETQIQKTRCEAMSSNEQSGSTVFPDTQNLENLEKMEVDQTKEDTKKVQESMSSKKAYAAETKKQQDDIQHTPVCLNSDCICKKKTASLGKLADVQQEVQQLLRSVPMSEETTLQTKHLLRVMQQHLRQLTRKQHTHLQTLRELTKQPTTSQPPDLKSQLKQIMAEKQQMLQLLKQHHTLASTLNVVTKETSVDSDKQQATDGSPSDRESVKSVSSHISTSMLTGTGKSMQHTAANSTSSAISPMSPVPGNPAKIKGISGSTTSPSKPSTASNLSSVDYTSAPGRIQSKWVPPHAIVETSVKPSQTMTVRSQMTHKQNASASEDKVFSATKTIPAKSMKDHIVLTTSKPLSTEDINKIVETHLSQQHQTTGKTFQPTKIVISQKPQTTTSISLPLHPHAGQNMQRPTTNFLPGDKSIENKSSARLCFPTLAKYSVNPSVSRLAASNQTKTSTSVTYSMRTNPTSVPQYYMPNVTIPSQLVSSQPRASNPPIRLQTAMNNTTHVTPVNIIRSNRGTVTMVTTANVIPPASYHVSQSANQSYSQFSVPQRPNTQNISSSNLCQNMQNGNLAPTKNQDDEGENANISKECLESQQATLDRVQVSKKPATLMQLLDAKLLQPGQDVLSFTASVDEQTHRASLDAKGFIIDKDRGCFMGPSQWVAAITTKSVASASKIAWKFVHFRGESLVSLQQQWAARQVPSGSTITQKLRPVSLESQTVLEQSIGPKHDLGPITDKNDVGLMLLASDVRVHLIMTEELYPVTKADWEDIPSHVYADIDRWE